MNLAIMRALVWSAGLSFVAALSARADVQQVAGKPITNRIRPNLLVISAAWRSQIPPSGRVNAPEFLSVVYPGQKVTLAILAEGTDREQMLKGITLEARLSSEPGKTIALGSLKPIAVRQIKAEGADFALLALKAGGIAAADQAKLAEATSFVTLAVFAPGWTVPADPHATEIEISAILSGPASPVTLAPPHLKIRSTADWLKEPPPTQEQMGKQMNRYHGDLLPGQIVSLLAAAAKNGSLNTPAVSGFFAFALKLNSDARLAAVNAYGDLGPEVQPALLWVLRLGGFELNALFPQLPPETIAPFKAVEPLPEPGKFPRFQDPVDPQDVSRIGTLMDQCWAAWMAAGNKDYLRALIDLLGAAADYPAFKSWKEGRGGLKGLNASVARGLAYQIAGWSISSFERTDPHVADWLLYWQDDPTVSTSVRKEIASLPANPAFRQQ